MREPRLPGDVPDDPAVPQFGDLDTDGDGRRDTVVYTDGVDLVFVTDLDADGLADQVLRAGPDGVVRELLAPPPPVPGVLDLLFGGAGLLDAQ